MADGKISSLDAFDAQGLNDLYLWITSWLRSETKVLPSGGGIREITSSDDSLTVTDPGGPTTDLAANVQAPISTLSVAAGTTSAAMVQSTNASADVNLGTTGGFTGSQVNIGQDGPPYADNGTVEIISWFVTVGDTYIVYHLNAVLTVGEGSQAYGENLQLLGGDSSFVYGENNKLAVGDGGSATVANNQASGGDDGASVTGRNETLTVGADGAIVVDLIAATGGTDSTVTGLQHTLHGVGTGDVTNTLTVRSVNGEARALILDATSTGSGVPYALLVANGYVDLGLPGSDPSIAGAIWNKNGLVVQSGFAGITLADMSGAFTYLRVQTGVPSAYDRPLVYDNTAVTGGLYAWDGSAYQKVGPL